MQKDLPRQLYITAQKRKVQEDMKHAKTDIENTTEK